jgi:hypothetical protein
VRPITLPAGTYGWRYFYGKVDVTKVDTGPRGYIDLRILTQDAGQFDVTGVTLYKALPGASEHVRALLVIDSDSNLRESVLADGKRMRKMLELGLHGRVSITEYSGRRASPKNVLHYIHHLRTRPQETLLVYYAGHGATDPARGQMLTMKYGNLSRNDLMKTMTSKKAQMKILLSDCCANLWGLSAAAEAEIPIDPYVFRSLFFWQRGVADINACTTGESSWGDNRGGIFTENVAGSLYGRMARLDVNRDRLASWQEYFSAVRGGTQRSYRQMREQALRSARISQSMRDQRDQRPMAYRLDTKLSLK